jgi:hypothetical protein
MGAINPVNSGFEEYSEKPVKKGAQDTALFRTCTRNSASLAPAYSAKALKQDPNQHTHQKDFLFIRP